MSVLKIVISRCKNDVVATGQNKLDRFIIPHRLVNVLIYITAKKLYPWLKLQTVLIMCTVRQKSKKVTVYFSALAENFSMV